LGKSTLGRVIYTGRPELDKEFLQAHQRNRWRSVPHQMRVIATHADGQLVTLHLVSGLQ